MIDDGAGESAAVAMTVDRRDLGDDLMRSRCRVAIVCVTYSASRDFVAFAHSVAHLSGDFSLRLVVVDGSSPDDTIEVVSREAPGADICVLESNSGFAAGVNAGVTHVRETGGADIYVLANPDIRMEARCVERFRRVFLNPAIGVVFPQLVDDAGRREDSLRAETGPLGHWPVALLGGRLAERLRLPVEVVRRPGWYSTSHDVMWATGGLMAVSERCMAAVGTWSEHFFMYEEEVDFCVRARHLGFLARYDPSAIGVRQRSADRDAPWRYALVRVNAITSQHGRFARLSMMGAFFAADLLRIFRRQARAGLWAIATRARPVDVMRRYLPGVPVTVKPEGAAASRARVVHWGSTREVTQ